MPERDHLKFDTLFKTAPLGVFVVDGEGRYIDVNDCACAMSGYTRDELLNMNIVDLLHPEGLEHSLQSFQKLRETGSLTEITRCRKKDGTPLTLSLNAARISDDRFIAYCVDLTKELERERELELSKSKLELAQDAGEIGVWEWDVVDDELSWSDKTFEIFGYTPHSFTPSFETFKRHVHESDWPEVESVIKRSMATGERYQAEFRAVRTDGEVVHLLDRGMVIHGESGELRGMIGTVQDITRIRDAEEALRRSHTQLKVAEEAANIGIWDWGIESGSLYWSDETYRLFGFQPGEITPTYELFLSLLNDEDRLEVDRKVRRAVETQTPYSATMRVTRSDGEMRIFNARGRTLIDEGGRPVRLVGAVHDITELRDTEKQLAELNRALSQERNMFLSGAVVVFKWRNSPGWPVEYVSPNVSEVFAYSATEFVRGEVSYGEIIHPDDISRVTSEVSEGGKNKKTQFIHEPYRIRKRDGAYVWLADYTTIVRDDEGEITHYLGYVFDVTELQTMKATLKETERRYHDLLEQAPDGVGMVVGGKVVYMNPAMEEISGYKAEELIGSAFDFLLEPAEKNRAREIVRRIFSGEKVGPSRYSLKRKDGTIAPIEVHSRVETIANTQALISIVRDMSERAKLEEKLVAHKQQLQTMLRQRSRQLIHNERLASVGRILAGFVHQIGNPLQGMRGALERIQSMSSSSPELAQLIERIMKSQARIEGLSTQVRSIYRPQQESLQPIELNEVIVDTVDLYSYQLGKNNIACELDLTAADTTISGNAKLLYTLIGNLLSNSIDAVAKNGRVLIQTRTENGKVQLRVEDNGAGIPAEIRDRIFEPFFTTKDPELGTGLGLYLVDEATKKLGGAIILNGGPESGAVFEVTLPMVDNSNKSDS